MIEEFDVIVIGAGFGGPVAALICAEAGLKTLIIERSENVGDKVISGLTIPFYGFLFGPDFIRDGNPPIERPSDGIINYIIKDIEKGDIEIDDSLRVPKPFSPIIAFGYNAYCKPFCEWEVRKAIEAGAILKKSTTVIDVIKEDRSIKGVITDKGEKIRCKVVIDAEGSKGLLAIKAGVREKYLPETISLADTYDYIMEKEDVDRIFGYSVKMCWGWDEQRIAPPLGYGNGLMVWPYRNSLHFMQDQCLRINGGPVPNLNRLFQEYHKNITKKLLWWKNLVAPQAKLRARMWDGFEIYVGLNTKLRKMANHTDGMILIGDAAGLESTELCDGVPAAWFSAEIAANIAIEAITANDTSKIFLEKYDQKIKEHSIIMWSISGRNRYDLRNVQKEHNIKKLRKYIHNGWGLGALTHFMTPFLKLFLVYVKNDPTIITKWIKMFFRYYQNWIYESYDYSSTGKGKELNSKKLKRMEKKFTRYLRVIDSLLKSLKQKQKFLSAIIIPISNSLNILMKNILPIFEPLYSFILKLLRPISNRYAIKVIKFAEYANPIIFKNLRGIN
ncbi:MAG: NAD(P)/FAD-dependent oxidoreductase [Candidatus Lokiarchaeia archaeon]|nr:NAD(P)/FAD-dependent oxidoreductase [Candidatus Lokiarchaeia archaeon]